MSKNDKGYIDALKKYAHADNVKLPDVFEGLKSESDRSLVVIAGSLVEDSLAAILKARMREPANGRERGELWGPQGLLGTFSAKTKISYALSLIDPKERDQVDILREMRNACAHAQMPIDFATPELVAAFDNFIKLTRDADLVGKPYIDKKARRLAFYIEALNLASDLNRKSHYHSRGNALATLIDTPAQQASPPDPQATSEK